MYGKILLVLCLCCAAARAQRYSFVNYTPKDGLVNSRVQKAVQDSRGRIFFLTHSGLSMFDGARFTNYSRASGLATDIVNDMIEAGPDSFLVACNITQLNTLVQGRVGVLTTRDHFCPVINRFLVCPDKTIYVSADEGLFKFTNGVFSRIPLFAAGSPYREQFLYFLQQWDHYLLISSWEPIYKDKLILFDLNSGKVTDVDTLHPVLNILGSVREQSPVLTTATGIYELDRQQLALGHLRLVPKAGLPQIGGSPFSGITRDPEGKLWLYNYNTVAMPESDGSYRLLRSEQGLEANSISNLFIDRERIVWILTDGSGVSKMANRTVSLLNPVSGTVNITAASMTCGKDTNWVYDAAKNQVLRFTREGVKIFQPRINGNYTQLFVRGQALYLSNNKGVFRVKDKDNPLSYRQEEPYYLLLQPGASVGHGILDSRGLFHFGVLINTENFLVSIENPSRAFFYKPGGFIDQIREDNRQRIWCITRQNELLVFSVQPEKPDSLLQLLHNYKNEIPPGPRSFTLDSAGNIWMGTREKGVYRLEMKNLQLKGSRQLSTREGLTDNFIYALELDRQNNCWVGSQNGLDKISYMPDSIQIENISRNNNYFEGVTQINIDSSNQVWARCFSGNIIRVENPLSTGGPYFPQIFLTDLRINEQSFPLPTGTLHCSYQQNRLSFSFAAPTFLNEHSTLFSYLLEGSKNNQWSTPDSKAEFSFFLLAPGKYQLRVKAHFSSPLYPDQYLSIAFVIHPPWWQTWWFRLLAFLLLVAILALVNREYIRRRLVRQRSELEKQQAIEKERTRIATDMHDDLGAGLSRIKFLSETIGIKKQQQLPFEEEISKIRDYSHEMIDKMGEIVWALNEKNDTLSDLLAYTRSYAVEYLLQNGIHSYIEAPENLPEGFVTGEYRRNVFLSVKEALHNVVKHAGATEVTIRIGVDTSLRLVITDNGIGLDPLKQRPFGNGLNNLQQRMADIGGSMEISGKVGTTVILTAPLPK